MPLGRGTVVLLLGDDPVAHSSGRRGIDPIERDVLVDRVAVCIEGHVPYDRLVVVSGSTVGYAAHMGGGAWPYCIPRVADGDTMIGSDFRDVVERFQGALDEFFRGNPEPAKAVMSHRDDVTLANPFGPVTRGWEQVDKTMDLAGKNYRDGAAIGFESASEYVGSELAYTVWVERFRAKVGQGEDAVEGALRRTSVFRREDGEWKVIHTHADPITTARRAESVIPG